MNWLSHVFLSENSIEHQLGNLLTDSLKAKAWEGASEPFYRGIKTHKLIDSFTDNHIIVSQSKARLGERGYLKAVVIDIVYDYFLTIHWNKFSNITINNFLFDFHNRALDISKNYPLEAKNVINRVVNNKILLSYNNYEGLEKGFKRIDNRLSDRMKKRDTASRYMHIVIEEIENLEEDFLIFFPELMEHIRKDLNCNLLRHWNIT